MFYRDLFSVLYYSVYIFVIFFYFLEDVDISSFADSATISTVKESKEFIINTLDASPLPLFT